MYIVSIFHEGCPSSSMAAEPLNPERKCPTCQTTFDSTNPKWTVNRLTCPIVETQLETACFIVIKPTNGSFRNFKIGDDLHIGISNSQGVVYSFWTKGVEIEASTWQNSVPLLDLRPFFFGNLENIDNCIEFFVETQKMSQKFHKSKYRETTPMADFLEEVDDKVDSNRVLDQADYLVNQFEKFTHDFREKTEPECCADTDSDHSKCKKAEEEVRRNKKEIVNVTRRLQKAIYSLEMMPSASDLLIALRDKNAELRDTIVKLSAEFSTSSVPIPEYDTVDMKCLLGDDQVADQKSLLELVKEEQAQIERDLNRILLECEILLRDYDHYKNGLKV
uniref:C-CAP/cofactor C-like domain-containing protein n=1 Tax=Caenorhabditis tropicalis TaxID=1561998 RepID=A0A1I7TG98_9PELO